jgi:tRNA G18 (ribose-2'-O)-methylase SpoU
MSKKTGKFKEKFVVILDNIRSAQNVGSIFRTSDASGIDRLYLCGITPTPYPQRGIDRVSKVSLGAEKKIEWEYHNQTWRLIEKLKEEGYKIVALEITENAIDYKDFSPEFPLALVLGNEVKGLGKKILSRIDSILNLPMHGSKESLNVSVAFGITAYKINEFRN